MEKAKKEGNDVVIIKNLSDRKDWGNYEPATHYAVIDTNKLKTRSQLKAEWDKIGDNGVVFNTDAVKITGASNLTKGTIPEIVTKSIKQAKASGQSFDEWVKGQMKPHYIDIKDIKSSLDADTFSTLKGIPRSRNIDLLSEYKSKVKKIEKSPVGREVTNPISIEINVDGGDGYRIIDGNHRYLQAIKNGNNKILAQFKSPKGTSEEGKNIFQIKTLSQLKAEWDKILVK
jgi:hypothetical protein